jgi:predicted ATPase
MNSQVIISTHSPVIMSIPNATIIHLSSEGLKKIDYSDVDQINELKHFLNHPEAYFKHLL